MASIKRFDSLFRRWKENATKLNSISNYRKKSWGFFPPPKSGTIFPHTDQ